MKQGTSWWKFALQFGIGLGVIAVVGIIAFFLWPRPEVPSGWQTIRPPNDVMAMVEYEDAIWAGGRDGLMLIDRETGELIREVELDGDFKFVTALILDPTGDTLWVSHLNGITQLRGKSWKTYTTSDGLLDDQIFSLGYGPEGTLWVGTAKGVMRFDGLTFHSAPEDVAVLQRAVSVIFLDGQDRMWFGNGQTTDGGLVMFDGDVWHEFSIENGLVHNMVNAIVEDGDGLVWIGTGFANLGGMSLYDGASMMNFAVKDGLAGPKVRSLYLDAAENLWAGSEYDGIALIGRSGRSIFTPKDGLAGWEVKATLQDSEMNLWLGTENGLTRIEREAWEQLVKDK